MVNVWHNLIYCMVLVRSLYDTFQFFQLRIGFPKNLIHVPFNFYIGLCSKAVKDFSIFLKGDHCTDLSKQF